MFTIQRCVIVSDDIVPTAAVKENPASIVILNFIVVNIVPIREIEIDAIFISHNRVIADIHIRIGTIQSDPITRIVLDDVVVNKMVM